MQREHNFATATQLNSSVCLQTPCTETARTGAFTTAAHALKDAAAGFLRHLNIKPVAAASAQQVCLGPHQLWSARLYANTSISCRTGVLWITRGGDAQDYILRAGQVVSIYGNANVVISTFSDAAEFSIQKT